MVEIVFYLAQSCSRVWYIAKTPAELVLTKADVTALVLYYAEEDLASNGVGSFGVSVKDGELERFENHVLRQYCRLPILALYQFEEAVLESEEAMRRTLFDLCFGI